MPLPPFFVGASRALAAGDLLTLGLQRLIFIGATDHKLADIFNLRRIILILPSDHAVRA